MPDNLLEVKDLRTQFATEDGVVTAVDGVSFELPRGGTLGIVGESGCGKSVTSLSIMRLIPNPPGKIVGGTILFEGEDLLLKREREMRAIRGRDISMIFQEPMTSLNPIMTVGNQIIESIRLHRDENRAQARARATEMLRRVGIPTPEKRLGSYPHQLSGGLRQRVMIAMALVSDAKLLIADEPTTALDVTIQAQILRLMRKMRAELGTSIILITHDLGVVAGLADEVVVMYAGRIVERASVRSIFKEPRHPYTAGLLESIPSMARERDRLKAIRGVVPSPFEIPPGCAFRPRCARATARCAVDTPALAPVEGSGAGPVPHSRPEPDAAARQAALPHLAACWNPLPQAPAGAGGGAA